MSTSKDWLPASHSKLYQQSFLTKNYLDGHFGDFGISGKSAEWVNNNFKVKWQAFANAFLAWQNTSERTPAKIAALQDAERDFKPAYRELFRAFLKNNPNVGDNDLVAMGLPKRVINPPTPVPVPHTFPVATIEWNIIRQLAVHYVDSKTGKKGKPHGVAGAVVHWAVLDTPPMDVNELTNSMLKTASPFILDFPEELRKRTAYFCLAWQNPRGEKGPWGEIVSAMIP